MISRSNVLFAKHLVLLVLVLLTAVPTLAQNEPEADSPNLVRNWDFSAPIGASNWQVYATPTLNAIRYRVTNGVFEFHRYSGGSTALVLQDLNTAIPLHTPVEISLDLGNSSSTRKRVVVLIHDGDWSDLQVCSFWIAPGAPLQNRVMRTYTTEDWTDAHIAIYASPAEAEGWIRVDNVVMRTRPTMPVVGTECYEPGASIPNPVPSQSDLEALLPSFQPTLAPTATPILPPGELPLLATPAPFDPASGSDSGEGQFSEQ
jgi:hypothetical protein